MYQYIVQIIYTRNVCRNLSQIIVFYRKIVTLSESPENARRKSGVLFLYSCLKIAAQKSILYA